MTDMRATKTAAIAAGSSQIFRTRRIWEARTYGGPPGGLLVIRAAFHRTPGESYVAHYATAPAPVRGGSVGAGPPGCQVAQSVRSVRLSGRRPAGRPLTPR